MSRPLDDDEQRRLLDLARAALRDHLFADGALDRELQRRQPTAALSEPRGAFVTLWSKAVEGPAGLRGCIGKIEARQALFRTVIEAAGQAAFEDPRFAPLAAEQLDETRIEISALTPLSPVDGPREIQIGRHGVQLRCDGGGAVFLPQVAREHGWDRETLLKQLSLKAGLAEQAWRDGQLSVFEAEVFGEPCD